MKQKISFEKIGSKHVAFYSDVQPITYKVII
jgi:hypothetical protein